MPKRKVSKGSVHNTLNKRRVRDYLDGGYSAEGTDWTNRQLDELLDAFLAFELPWVSKNKPCLLKVAKRTVGAIKVTLWKLAGRYHDRPHIANYTPETRVRRTRSPLSERELALISLATNFSGISRLAYDVSWLSKILARNETDTSKVLDSIAGQAPRRATLGVFQSAGTHPLVVRAELVHNASKKYLRTVLEEIGEV